MLLFSHYVMSDVIIYVIVSSNQYVSAWRAKIITFSILSRVKE